MCVPSATCVCGAADAATARSLQLDDASTLPLLTLPACLPGCRATKADGLPADMVALTSTHRLTSLARTAIEEAVKATQPGLAVVWCSSYSGCRLQVGPHVFELQDVLYVDWG